MNNNNRGNNNNRRRGRGNSRPQGGGSGQQLNRIDSRARGNAPQLLEKYRKLAHDAHLNGDRVTAEYYLQYADHYFRVLADQRTRQEEQRGGPRQNERWQEGGEGPREDGDDSGEFSVESDFPTFDQPPVYTRRDREERSERPERNGEGNGEERGTDRGPERSGAEWPRRHREDRPAPATPPEPEASEGENDNGGEADRSIYEPPQNPFVRENRVVRGLRPRRDDRRPARGEDEASDPPGIDPASLPPSIALSSVDLAADDEPPAPKRPRGRPRKTPAADAGEAMAPAEQD